MGHTPRGGWAYPLEAKPRQCKVPNQEMCKTIYMCAPFRLVATFSGLASSLWPSYVHLLTCFCMFAGGIKPTVFIGHSLGGLVMQQVVLEFSDRAGGPAPAALDAGILQNIRWERHHHIENGSLAHAHLQLI